MKASYRKTLAGLTALAAGALLMPAPCAAGELSLRVEGGERTLYRGGQEYILAECAVEGAADPTRVTWDLLQGAADDPVVTLLEDSAAASVTVYLHKDGMPPDAGDYVAMLTGSLGDWSDTVILSAHVQDAPAGPLYGLDGIGDEYTLAAGETLTVLAGTDPAGWSIPGEDTVFAAESVMTELGMPCGEGLAEVSANGDSVSVRFPEGGIYLVTFGMRCANFHVTHMAAVTVLYEDGTCPISALPDGVRLEETLIRAEAGVPFSLSAVLEPEGLRLRDAVIRSEVRFNGRWTVISENGLGGQFTVGTAGVYPCVYRAVIGNASYECPFQVVCSPAGEAISVPEGITVTVSYPERAEAGTIMGSGFSCEGIGVSWRISAFRDGVPVDEQSGESMDEYRPLTLTKGEWRFVLSAYDALGRTAEAEAMVTVAGE